MVTSSTLRPRRSDNSSPWPLLSASQRTGRKSNKSSKKDGPIWPPHLEDALLRELQDYRPTSKSGRRLLRLPKRNVTIANGIYRRTGEWRTPKQVGSRLQQIAESSVDSELRDLVRGVQFRGPPASDRSSESSVADAESPMATSVASSPSAEYAHSLSTPSSSISGDDLTSQALRSFSDDYAFSLFVQACELDPGTQFGLEADIPESPSQAMNVLITLDQVDGSAHDCDLSNARIIHEIPSSTLLSQVPNIIISATTLDPTSDYYCVFEVYRNGSCRPESRTETALANIKTECGVSQYTTTFPPRWNDFKQTDLSEYTIRQHVLEQRSALNSSALVTLPRFSFDYTFRHLPEPVVDEPQPFPLSTFHDATFLPTWHGNHANESLYMWNQGPQVDVAEYDISPLQLPLELDYLSPIHHPKPLYTYM